MAFVQRFPTKILCMVLNKFLEYYNAAFLLRTQNLYGMLSICQNSIPSTHTENMEEYILLIQIFYWVVVTLDISCLYSQRNNSMVHCTGIWMGCRDILDTVVKRDSQCFCFESDSRLVHNYMLKKRDTILLFYDVDWSV